MGRRAWGEGSIWSRQMPDGRTRWYATVEVHDADGRRRVSRSTYDKSKVRGLLRELQRASTTSERATLTLAEYLERWLADVAPTVRVRTLDGYRVIVARHIVPALGSILLERLTKRHITAWRDTMLTTAAPRTVVHAMQVLRAAIRRAHDEGLVPRNEAKLVELPKTTRTPVDVLTAEGAATFLAHVKSDPLEPLYLLAFTTGMRQGELLGLRWADIDWGRRTLTVNQTLVHLRGRFYADEPKTERSRRTIPLAPVVLEALREHRRAQLDAGTDSQGLVFTRPGGSPIAGSWLTFEYQRQLAAAGLPKSRFHDVRHAVATEMLRRGESIYRVQALLGHSTISTTVDIYSHITADDLRESVDRNVAGG